MQSSTIPITAFGVGAGLGLLTSGGLIEDRLSLGRPAVVLAVNIMVSGAALLAVGLVRHRLRLTPTAVGAQALGGAVGILLAHLAVRAGLVVAPSWLAERPAQLVNDAVAVFSTLALVWASASDLDFRLLVGTLVAVTIYRATGHLWHVDAPPRAFQQVVQDVVIAQCAAAAIALGLYRELIRHDA